MSTVDISLMVFLGLFFVGSLGATFYFMNKEEK